MPPAWLNEQDKRHKAQSLYCPECGPKATLLCICAKAKGPGYLREVHREYRCSWCGRAIATVEKMTSSKAPAPGERAS